MSRARVAVLKVTTHQLSVTAAAAEYGYSRRHLHRLLARYAEGGLEAVDPRSRRPASNSAATPHTVRERIIELRLQLTKDGLDAGPVTIAWHLEQEGHRAPAVSTIRRILHTAGLVVPEPRKRPRSSYRRFAAAQPNECWQSDFTHWRLADGTDVEILNFLDDHSRYLLGCTAHTPVTGDLVTNQFLATADEHGLPASTLTDNGRVYTARFGGGKNAFEYLLAVLGITQKNGHPGHPQTQGKIERFHQTLKRWLAQQPPAATVTDLQHQLDRFRHLYNHHRPHRELARRTPAQAYTALPKAAPPGSGKPDHYRLRYDRLDTLGKMSFRRAGRMHHLGIGATHAGKRVLAIADDTTVTVIHLDTGELLSSHRIEPSRSYWRNTQKPRADGPRLPEQDTCLDSGETYVATHDRVELRVCCSTTWLIGESRHR
jgi:transposase InsO family protein